MKWLARLSDSYYPVLLLLILAFAFFTRVYRLHVPEDYYFDEVYHAVTAKLIARDDPRAFEWWNPAPEKDTAVDWLHPPLAKYTQALSIRAFGENSFGWRFSSVVFGVLTILVTAQLARAVTGSKQLALLAALLTSLDGLLLTQSRIAMNDIHVTFWIILTLLLYVRARQERNGQLLFASVATGGIALATKWSGLFVLVLILAFEIFDAVVATIVATQKKKQRLAAVARPVSRWIGFLLISVSIVATVYLSAYWQMFAQGKDLQHFKELHDQIFYYQLHLDATHPAQSRPWQWFLDLRPVWLWVEYPETGKVANMYAFGNPVLFWSGAIAVIVVSFGFARQLITHLMQKKWQQFAELVQTNDLLLIILAYWIVWLPWILSPRIMFFYHYAPAVPLLSIILATQLHRISKSHQALVIGVVGAAALVFCVWYPHWTGMPVSTEFADRVYFAIPSWRQQ